jgi:hypothetical protein
MVKRLEEHLTTNLYKLTGDWVNKNSNYEPFISDILEMNDDKCRYWDSRWQDFYLEFKKGTSVWLDLVRYSEIITEVNDAAVQKVFSLFFVPNKERERIVEIICVETDKIIETLKLDVENAKSILAIHQTVPRSLNAQASLTLKDLRQIATFIIK